MKVPQTQVAALPPSTLPEAAQTSPHWSYAITERDGMSRAEVFSDSSSSSTHPLMSLQPSMTPAEEPVRAGSSLRQAALLHHLKQLGFSADGSYWRHGTFAIQLHADGPQFFVERFRCVTDSLAHALGLLTSASSSSSSSRLLSWHTLPGPGERLIHCADDKDYIAIQRDGLLYSLLEPLPLSKETVIISVGAIPSYYKAYALQRATSDESVDYQQGLCLTTTTRRYWLNACGLIVPGSEDKLFPAPQLNLALLREKPSAFLERIAPRPLAEQGHQLRCYILTQLTHKPEQASELVRACFNILATAVSLPEHDKLAWLAPFRRWIGLLLELCLDKDLAQQVPLLTTVLLQQLQRLKQALPCSIQWGNQELSGDLLKPSLEALFWFVNTLPNAHDRKAWLHGLKYNYLPKLAASGFHDADSIAENICFALQRHRTDTAGLLQDWRTL